MIKIVALSTVLEGKRDEFLAIAKPLIAGSQSEAGNISYILHEDINNPNILTFIEEWKDQDAIDFHNATPHFTANAPKLLEIIEGGAMVVNLYKAL